MDESQDIGDDSDEAEVPLAVAGIRRLRERLMEAVPEFRATVEAARENDAFIASVRAELAARRQAAGLKPEDVARELEITQSAVAKLETGTGDLSLLELAEYCQAIGYRPVVLMVPTTATAYDAAAHRAAPVRAQATDIPAPVSAAIVEQAQVALLRGMSDMMPGVLAGLLRPA